jgi:hypothetical protein
VLTAPSVAVGVRATPLPNTHIYAASARLLHHAMPAPALRTRSFLQSHWQWATSGVPVHVIAIIDALTVRASGT